MYNDWLAAFYQTDLDSLYPGMDFAFCDSKYTAHFDLDQSYDHHLALVETLNAYSQRMMEQKLHEVLNKYVLAVPYYNGKMGIFSGDLFSDVEKIDMGVMWADELYMYTEISALEQLDEDGSDGASIVRNYMLGQEISKLQALIDYRTQFELSSRSIETKVFGNANFYQYQNDLSGILNPLGPSLNFQSICLTLSYNIYSSRMPRVGMNNYIKYVDTYVNLHGRNIQLSGAIYSVLTEIRDEYVDMSDFRRYQWAIAHEFIQSSEFTDFFVSRMNNMFKTRGRSMGGYFDDLFQEIRHKIYDVKFHYRWSEIRKSNFIDLLYYNNLDMMGAKDYSINSRAQILRNML